NWLQQKEQTMLQHQKDALLKALGEVAAREEQRAHAEFAAEHGREYDGSSDEDWDKLDKSYCAVEFAMGIVAEASPKAGRRRCRLRPGPHTSPVPSIPRA